MIKMNVFQYCLKALDTENQLCDLTILQNQTNTTNTIDSTQEQRRLTIQLSDLLHQTAEVYATSTEDEQCRAFPFVLSSVMKPLARVIESSNPTSQTTNTPATITASLSQLSVSAVSTLVTVLQSLLSLPVSGKNIPATLSSTASALFLQHSATIERLVCMVGVLLDLSRDRIDTLASSPSPSSINKPSICSISASTSGLYADDEAMALVAFGLFTLTYTQWMSSSPSSLSSSSIQTPALHPSTSLHPSTTQPTVPSLDPSIRDLPMGPFTGPFLAHTAQLALSFAMHRSKHVATSALKFLHTALSMCVDDDGGDEGVDGDGGVNGGGRNSSENAHPATSNNGCNQHSVLINHQRQEQWRSYLPGLFSGLFAVCALPRIQRGAAVQGLALECLLLLLRVTTCDSYDQDDTTTTTTTTTEDDMEAHRALDQLLATLGHKNNKNNKNNDNDKVTSSGNGSAAAAITTSSSSTSTSNNTSTTTALPPSLSSLSSQQQQQWRVQVLQRIDAHIPSLFCTIYIHCNGLPGQQQRLVHALSMLLLHSARFLGCGVEGRGGMESGGGVVSPCYRSLLLLLLRIAVTSVASSNNVDDDDIDELLPPAAQRQRLVSAWQGWLAIRSQSSSRPFQTYPLLRHALLTAVQETIHSLAELLDIPLGATSESETGAGVGKGLETDSGSGVSSGFRIGCTRVFPLSGAEEGKVSHLLGSFLGLGQALGKDLLLAANGTSAGSGDASGSMSGLLPRLLSRLLQPDPSLGAARAILVEAREYALPPLSPIPSITIERQRLASEPTQLVEDTTPSTPTTTPPTTTTPITNPTPASASMFLLGAYYRPLCLCVRDQECVDMSRQLCMLLGSHGGLKELLEYTMRCQRRALRQGLAPGPGLGVGKQQQRQGLGPAPGQGLLGSEEIEEKGRFQRLSGAWQALSLMVLGVLLPHTAVGVPTVASITTPVTSELVPTTEAASTTTTPSPSPSLTPPACGFCHVEVKGGTGTPSRCSRCKSVNYCSVEHQRLHWPSHKPLCIGHNHKGQSQSVGQGGRKNGSSAVNGDARKPSVLSRSLSPQHLQSPMPLTPETVLKSHSLCYPSLSASPSSTSSSSSSSSSLSSSSVIVVVEGVVTTAVTLLRAYLDRGQGLGAGLASGQGLDPHTPVNQQQSFDSANMTTRGNSSSSTTMPNGGTPEQLALVFSVSLAVEAIAHCALVQGKERFRPRLAECLYPLVALVATSTLDAPSDPFNSQEQGLGPVVHPSVQLAACTTLARLAGYLHYHPHCCLHPNQTVPANVPSETAIKTVPAPAVSTLAATPSSFSTSSSTTLSLSLTSALLHDNMDYITDEVCARLRYSNNRHQPNHHQNSGNKSIRLPEVVDWVFSILVLDEERAQSNGSVKSTAVQSNVPVKSTAVVVMRDMLMGTLEHMDKLTGQGLGVPAQGQGLGLGQGLEISSLLRVMLAITQRLFVVPHLQGNIPTTTTTTTTTTTKPLAVPSPTIGVLGHARASLMAFHRSLRVLQGQGPEKDTEHKETHENINNNDDNVDNDGSPPSTTHASTTPSSIALQLLLDILPRACTQLSSPHLPHQILALACVRACFERLAFHSPAKTFLPAIHASWPSLMGRLKDQCFCLAALAHHTVHVAQSNSPVKSLTAQSNSPIKPTALPSTRPLALLPPLLDLFTLLATHSQSFFSFKFKDDLWPWLAHTMHQLSLIEAFKLITHPCTISPSAHGSAPGAGSHLALVSASVSPSDNAHTTTAYSSRTLPPSGSGSNSGNTSVETKVKLALLRFLLQLATLATTPSSSFCSSASAVMSYLRPIAGECIWYCLPLLCSHQPSAVIDLALVSVQALHQLDPAHTGTILQAIVYSSHQEQGSQKGLGQEKCGCKDVEKDKERAASTDTATTIDWSTKARASWLAVITEPRLVQSLARHSNNNNSHSNTGNSHNSSTEPVQVKWGDKLWQAYTKCDPLLAQRVAQEILAPPFQSQSQADERSPIQTQPQGEHPSQPHGQVDRQGTTHDSLSGDPRWLDQLRTWSNV